MRIIWNAIELSYLDSLECKSPIIGDPDAN